MAKTGLLSALTVAGATNTGAHAKRLCDGGGLYLQIKPAKTDPEAPDSKPVSAKSWLWRYKVDGESRMMGLGPYPDVSLKAARDKAAALRAVRHSGVDPYDAREATRLREKLEAAQTMTFRQCAETYISDHEAEWKNDKHRAQWRATLERYAYPDLGKLPVGSITTRLILNVLQQSVPANHDAAGGLVYPSLSSAIGRALRASA